MCETRTYIVLGLTCAHCERAVSTELEAVSGVSEVTVDLETKHVSITGETLDDTALRAAIEAAGYEAS